MDPQRSRAGTFARLSSSILITFGPHGVYLVHRKPRAAQRCGDQVCRDIGMIGILASARAHVVELHIKLTHLLHRALTRESQRTVLA